jgi:predicted  nucleic acid-binding Zn-ribbon protein
MSALGDALKALKDVVLMQERLDVMRAEQKRIADDVSGLSAYITAVDKRVVRIETMIEMTERQAKQPPRIEG